MRPEISSIVQDLSENNMFWGDSSCPFKMFVEKNEVSHPRILMIAGDNGSGKSLAVEYLRGWVKVFHEFATVQVSIRERTGAGLSDMAGMRRTFMFGDESEQSTGATSVRTTETAFKTLADRIKDGNPAILVLDEPDIGLSRSFAGAMGQYIGQRFKEVNSDNAYLVIISHNQTLAQELAKELRQDPAFVHMETPKTFKEWSTENRIRSIDELLQLPENDFKGRRAVWDIEAKINEEVKAKEINEEVKAKEVNPFKKAKRSASL